MSDLKISELLSKYELSIEDLEKECTEENIVKMAEIIGHRWELVSPYLHVNAEDVESDNKTAQLQSRACLQKWKELNGFKATYKALLNIILEVKLGNTARKICESLQKEMCSATSSHPQCTELFPYLEGIYGREREALEEKLKLETKKIIDKFVILADKVQQEVNANHQVENLKQLLVNYPNIYESTKDIDNFHELWLKVSGYWSFFDYDLVKMIIQSLCSQLNESMTEYESEFKLYCKRRLCEIPKDVLNCKVEEKDCLHLKLDEKFSYRDTTPFDIKALESKLSALLDTELILLKVEKGCLELVFGCLTSLPPYPLHCVSQLKELGISQMHGNYGHNYFNDEICKPTVSGLYYVLGNLTAQWEQIGKSLEFPEHDMKNISKNFNKSDRCMIELFQKWILRSDCKWSTIVAALEKIGQGKLANIVKKYTHVEPSTAGFNWLLCQTGDKLGTRIMKTDVHDIVKCLKKISNQWYELGCLLHMEKNDLDEIDKHHDSHKCLCDMLSKLSELRKGTWVGLQFILKEIDLSNLSADIEKLAEEKKISHIDLHPKFKRKNFVPEYYNPESFDKIRDVLQVSSTVSNDDMIEDLYEHIEKKKKDSGLTVDDLDNITKCVKHFADLCSGHLAHIKEKAKELGEELKQQRETTDHLQIAMKEMEYNMSKLNKEENQIILALSKSYDQSLEQKLRDVKMKISQAHDNLKECSQQVKEAEVKYDIIKSKLKECKLTLLRIQKRLMDITKASEKWISNKELLVDEPVVQRTTGRMLAETAANIMVLYPVIRIGASLLLQQVLQPSIGEAIAGLWGFGRPVGMATAAVVGHRRLATADNLHETIELCAQEMKTIHQQIEKIDRSIWEAEQCSKKLRFGVLT